MLPEPFDAPFMQRALLEILLLAGLAGVLGAWIVLRRFAFFTHGVGTAAFPGLGVAAPAGVAPQLTGLAAALLYAGGVEWLGRTRRVAVDAATGLMLVGALALGVVLVSDVFESGAGVDRLLFGSLIGLSDRDLWLTAAALAAAVALDVTLRRSWLAQGFDPATAGALGTRPAVADRLLLAAVAAAAVVALDAVGALLVTAVLVIPAATVRLLAPSVAALQAGTAALAAVEGVAGLWLAYELDVGPGPAIAVLGGGLFAVVAVLTAALRRWA
jgi:ABC-type Mn2+/Zn2+ transport system permease subunit